MRLRHLGLLTVLLAVVAIVSASGLSACADAQRSSHATGIAGAIAAPGSVTTADEKAMFATEALLNRVSAAAKLAAPHLSAAARAEKADQLERAWELLLDARCVHRTLNGQPIPKSQVTRCGRAVLVNGADYRPLLDEASAIARGLQLFFGVK